MSAASDSRARCGVCGSPPHQRTSAGATPPSPTAPRACCECSKARAPTTPSAPGSRAVPAWARALLFLVCIALCAMMLTPCAPGAAWYSVTLCSCITMLLTEAMAVMLPAACSYTQAWTRGWAAATHSLPHTAVRCISRNSWLSRPSLALLSLTTTWTPLLMPMPVSKETLQKTRWTSRVHVSASCCEGL